MRKLKINKDAKITGYVILEYIEKHKKEKNRLNKMYKYYNNDNEILNRSYKTKNKPQNKLAHSYASYITDVAIGYFLGKPISYTSSDKTTLETLNDIFKYNDEADNNTTIAKYESIFGYAYEVLYLDENLNIRFKAIDPRELIVVYDNTLQEDIVFAIRYYNENELVNNTIKEITKVEVYRKPILNDKGKIVLNGKIEYYTKNGNTLTLDDEKECFFCDIPIITYINNDELYGDFEKVIQLIDAYDKTQSDTANDFEMFTHAVLVVSGSVVDEEDKKDLNDKYLINFINEEGKADYLIKNIQDTALENYKNRLDNDIHKFSCVPNMSDESFSNNASGVSLAFKLMSLENKVGIKEAKFKKGLMRRIELICDYLKIKKGNEYSYTDIEPVFSRNKPSNEAESAEIMQKLTGILSQETIISLFPSISDPQKEMEKIDKEKDNLFDDYDFNKISNEIKNKKDNLENLDIKENEDREGSTDVKEK